MQQPGPDESLDDIIGSWRVFQLKGGHRFSTDDTVVAWRGAVSKPNAIRCLDLGCGIGSVALQVLYRMAPAATMVGIEAQELSVGLARRSIALNGLAERFSLVQGDIRDPNVLPADARFDLITGSPPYFPLGTALVSPHPQRAGARMELLGSVLDYAQAARRWAAPGARFAYVMLADDPRTERAATEHGWVVIERLELCFRQGRKPHICVLVCALADDGPHPARTVSTLTVRDAQGVWTREYQAFRASLDLRDHRA